MCAPYRRRQPRQRRVERPVENLKRSGLCKFTTLQARNSGNQLSKGEALMTHVRSILLASAASLVIAGSATSAMAADQILNGAIASAAGEKLRGVTGSAKPDGSTITTSVYTDATGNYYFPPLPAGKYQVWAQALSFETSKASIDLAATAHQDLVLKQITDPEQQVRQLPSELL